MPTNSLGFGAYYPIDSIIHQLDPRVKIIITVSLMTLIFTTTQLWTYLLVGVLLVTISCLGKVMSVCLRRIRSIWLLLVLMMGITILLTPGRPILSTIATYEGVKVATQMALRLVLIVTISSLLTLTTSPFSLTRGIESMLTPFRKIGVPVSEIAMIIQLTLRFIPTFMRERDKIMKAQAARGYGLETKSFIEKSKGMMVLVVPLLASSFRRVDELAGSMDARCYVVGARRSNLREMKLRQRDYWTLFIIAIFVTSMIIFR